MDGPKYNRYFCTQPFSTASVNANGEVFLCCAAFLNDNAGNLLDNTFAEVWNSERAQELRRTILDGTYSHCIEARCPFLQGEVLLQTKDEITDPIYRDIIDNNKVELETGPRELHAAYDATCNLACPYCRSDYIAFKGEELTVAERIHERVVEGGLGITKTLVMSSQGDPFASRLYSKILREFDAEKFPELRIRITTNGILFTRENWDAIRASHAALEQIHVSVNGASKKSFEENQRGASWEKLLENLEFLSKECRDNGGKQRFVTLSFIVQQNNFREMPAFVRMVQHFGFDRAHFGVIFHADRTFSDVEFAKLAVHWPHHPEHEELLRVMSDPALRAPEAYVVGGIAMHLPALRRYFGHTYGAAISGERFWGAEAVDWPGWAEAQGFGSMEGVSTPRMIAFSPTAEGVGTRIPFAAFASVFGLDESEKIAVRDALMEMHGAVTALFDAPASPGEINPLRAAANAARGGAVDSLGGAIAMLFKHAALAKPAGARATYRERFSRTELDFRQRIQRLLSPRQRKAYHALPIGNLFDVDVAHEPLTNRLRALVLEGLIADGTPRERMGWSEFTRVLGLGPLQEERAKRAVVQLKERAAKVLGKAPVDGGASPLMVIADSLRNRDAADEPHPDLDAMLRERSPEEGGATYAAMISELDMEAHGALGAVLAPGQRYRLTWLPVSSLVSVEVPGADPIGAAVAALVRQAGAAC